MRARKRRAVALAGRFGAGRCCCCVHDDNVVPARREHARAGAAARARSGPTLGGARDRDSESRAWDGRVVAPWGYADGRAARAPDAAAVLGVCARPARGRRRECVHRTAVGVGGAGRSARGSHVVGTRPPRALPNLPHAGGPRTGSARARRSGRPCAVAACNRAARAPTVDADGRRVPTDRVGARSCGLGRTRCGRHERDGTHGWPMNATKHQCTCRVQRRNHPARTCTQDADDHTLARSAQGRDDAHTGEHPHKTCDRWGHCSEPSTACSHPLRRRRRLVLQSKRERVDVAGLEDAGDRERGRTA